MAAQEKNPNSEKVLFVWRAQARPFKKRSREFYVTAIAIASVVGLILFLAEGAMPVILLAALIFLYYILNSVEPGQIENKITTRGIRVADKLTEWPQLIRFWFAERFNTNLLVFESAGILGRIELVIEKKDQEKLRSVLSEYLPEEKSSPNVFDNLAGWVSSKLPSEK